MTGVKINHGVSFAKNSRSKSLIFVGIEPLKYDAGIISMYGSPPGTTNCRYVTKF